MGPAQPMSECSYSHLQVCNYEIVHDDMTGRQCCCDDCDAALRAHSAADGVLKDAWLNQAFRGSCKENLVQCHTYCHACSSQFNNIRRMEVVIPAWDEQNFRLAWISEDVPAALGMLVHDVRLCGDKAKELAFLRTETSSLRGPASRCKLHLLGECHMLCHHALLAHDQASVSS